MIGEFKDLDLETRTMDLGIGAGLKLMNIDSRICEYVIADFVRTNTPILTVHDSFIVPFGEEDRLLQLTREAF